MKFRSVLMALCVGALVSQSTFADGAARVTVGAAVTGAGVVLWVAGAPLSGMLATTTGAATFFGVIHREQLAIYQADARELLETGQPSAAFEELYAELTQAEPEATREQLAVGILLAQ